MTYYEGFFAAIGVAAVLGIVACLASGLVIVGAEAIINFLNKT